MRWIHADDEIGDMTDDGANNNESQEKKSVVNSVAAEIV